MKYKLSALNIWELGKRANQEDSLFPAYGECKDSDRLFIVCDGMGGHDSGEVASATVCEAMSNAILSNGSDPEGGFDDSNFQEALVAAYDALDDKDTGAEKKMGTTMTFLKLHSDGATIAHIGDSRVYHIRPGKDEYSTQILFQTRDHSLVNDLIRIGELTPEEAKHSRQRNVITRAMQPNMEYRPKADIYHTSDIQAGDYFMLCSDGILEDLEDENFQYLFSPKGVEDENRIKMLVRMTQEHKDNHTAIIVHILEVENSMPERDENIEDEINSEPSPENIGGKDINPESTEDSADVLEEMVENETESKVDSKDEGEVESEQNKLSKPNIKVVLTILSVILGLLILYLVVNKVFLTSNA